MTGRRPTIPEAVKRQVRQECYFGCVLCGNPVYQYDHITEWSAVREHTIGNIALLCSNHHQEKSAGRISASIVIAARASPFNKHEGRTSPWPITTSAEFRVFVGSIVATIDMPPGRDQSVLWVSGEHYLIMHREDSGGVTCSIYLTDDLGRPILIVDHGEMTMAVNRWDITYKGRTLQIRERQGKVLLDMDCLIRR